MSTGTISTGAKWILSIHMVGVHATGGSQAPTWKNYEKRIMLPRQATIGTCFDVCFQRAGPLVIRTQINGSTVPPLRMPIFCQISTRTSSAVIFHLRLQHPCWMDRIGGCGWVGEWVWLGG